MASESRETPITPNIIARLATAARYAITGVTPDTWFGPQQPLTPQAPPDVKGRQWDYPFGVNLNYTPRSDSQLSFAELRALADALPLLRTVIETRKDQIAALGFGNRRDKALPDIGVQMTGAVLVEPIEFRLSYQEYTAQDQAQAAVRVGQGVGQGQGRAPRSAEHHPLPDAQPFA